MIIWLVKCAVSCPAAISGRRCVCRENVCNRVYCGKSSCQLHRIILGSPSLNLWVQSMLILQDGTQMFSSVFKEKSRPITFSHGYNGHAELPR